MSKNFKEFSLNVQCDGKSGAEGQLYTLKVYGGKNELNNIGKVDQVLLSSLFISNTQHDVKNKQPINKSEVRFVENVNMDNLIATLALNYDQDLSDYKDLSDNLVSLVRTPISGVYVDPNSKGVLPF